MGKPWSSETIHWLLHLSCGTVPVACAHGSPVKGGKLPCCSLSFAKGAESNACRNPPLVPSGLPVVAAAGTSGPAASGGGGGGAKGSCATEEGSGKPFANSLGGGGTASGSGTILCRCSYTSLRPTYAQTQKTASNAGSVLLRILILISLRQQLLHATDHAQTQLCGGHVETQ